MSPDILKAMPLSIYGNVAHEDLPECVHPIFQNPVPAKAESSGEDTDNYWPVDRDDPLKEQYIEQP